MSCRARAVALAATLIGALFLTLNTGAARADADPGGVTVFAAASLKTVLDEAARAFAAGGGTPTVASYAASSALAKQIEHGAPADLFISADLDWMDYLDEKSLIRRPTRTTVAGNALVLVAPLARPGEVRLEPGLDLAAALDGGRLAVADPRATPAGKYAKAALEHLGAWAGVRDRLAPAENVRAALALVALGEAPLGVVYRSDALAEPRVRTVATFPSASHPSIVYTAAVLQAARDPEAAAAFIAFLRSAKGQAVFARHGLTPVS
jgi:molybdate transport system substrate-binding protein